MVTKSRQDGKCMEECVNSAFYIFKSAKIWLELICASKIDGNGTKRLYYAFVARDTRFLQKEWQCIYDPAELKDVLLYRYTEEARCQLTQLSIYQKKKVSFPISSQT